MSVCVTKNFGFLKTPFTREVTDRESFETSWHKKEFSHIEETLKNRLSCVIVAQPGQGKTVFLRKIIRAMPDSRFSFHYVKCFRMCRNEMYREVCSSMGLLSRGNVSTLRQRFEDYCLNTCTSKSIHPVLILDDAHEIRSDVMGILKVVTNYEMDSRLALSFILCGHPILRQILKQCGLEDIAMRISHLSSPQSLSVEESEKYIRHRCLIAGSNMNFPFDQNALEAIIEQTGGNMRAMDDLCLKTLEIASSEDAKICNFNHVTIARSFLL